MNARAYAFPARDRRAEVRLALDYDRARRVYVADPRPANRRPYDAARRALAAAKIRLADAEFLVRRYEAAHPAPDPIPAADPPGGLIEAVLAQYGSLGRLAFEILSGEEG